MFFIGATFALKIIIPFAVKFLVGYKTENLVATISVNRYIDFVLKFTLAFGLVFELPLALTLGSRIGLVTPEFLSKNRKYAILINFVIAAILTPTPDAFNQLLMAGPLCLLYEAGIICARLFGRRKPVAALTPMRFGELDLPPEVHEGIQAAGFTTATPIQEAALPGRPPRQGRGGPGPDGDRQDGRVPDRDLHAAPPSPAERAPRGGRRAPSSSRPRASSSSRSTRTRACWASSPDSGRRSSSAAWTT